MINNNVVPKTIEEMEDFIINQYKENMLQNAGQVFELTIEEKAFIKATAEAIMLQNSVLKKLMEKE